MAAGRVDSASRIIMASPHAIYRALMDPEALVAWRPPEGMKGEMLAFDGREGGRYRMSLTYIDTGPELRGKTSEHADVVEGRFLELVLDRRVVEVVEFDSDDPAFAGAMTITTALAAVPGGTEVSIRCENVPDGIRPEDHQEGMGSTLANLAAFTE
ncbi:SRPBCC family protein [Mycobacterium sp. KBS0706]|uniref:SRPBCC family protein n=1 Tax=Mycobacterium sp. KBS0706 TaxID=2578109 RepID=UPI00110FA103|nr:SRPBCC family protein [Mycobacterium sp. KBS0706]TSD87416.1 SRPBCC family protein [Mycobacterium sp. KBS0706]